MSELAWSVVEPRLHRPVLVICLSGLFDAAGAAAEAVEWLSAKRTVETIARIDPDGFYDFSQHRPTVSLDEHGMRELHWPTNEFLALRSPGAAHDLVVLNGVEPDVRWRTFAACVLEVATTVGCDLVVTVGAFPEPVPHTRTPAVFGSTTTVGLARRLGLSRPQYQGPTGVVGVLHEALDHRAVPAIAMRVGVPHYLGNARHPKATMALLRHLEHVLGFPTRHAELGDEVAHWAELHDRAVASDPQVAGYVRMLEREFDRRAEAMVPTADDLGAAFEEFLREARPASEQPADERDPDPAPAPGPDPDAGPNPDPDARPNPDPDPDPGAGPDPDPDPA